MLVSSNRHFSPYERLSLPAPCQTHVKRSVYRRYEKRPVHKVDEEQTTRMEYNGI